MILLVRHAQSSGQAPGAPLTLVGDRQAEQLATDLAVYAGWPIFCSPYLRARQTSAPFARLTEVPVTELEDLEERVLSPEPRDDWLEHVNRSFRDPDHALPGGESLRQTADRGLAAIAKAGSQSIVVSHGNLIAAVLNRIDPQFGFDQWKALRNPHVILLHVLNGVPSSFESNGIATAR